MTPHCMLCFPNVFKIGVATRKFGKTDSMLTLKNYIHEITRNFRNLPVSGVWAFSPTSDNCLSN